MKDAKSLRFVFFGTAPLAHGVLEELEQAGYTPSLIIAAPDTVGRNGKSVPPPEKAWAESRHIPYLQPEKLDSDFINKLRTTDYTLFIVASYGKILPKELLEPTMGGPKYGALNIHPSLLPRLRGASPIRSAILRDDKDTGVTIIRMDEKVDHGPILAQRKISVPHWPPKGRGLDSLLAHEGGKLLAEILPAWISGKIIPQEQNHDLATYTEKIKKDDGFLDLNDDARKNLLKVCAYDSWPGVYTFFERGEKKVRVRITDAHVDEQGTFIVDRVIPEGKKEMSYEDFLRGFPNTGKT